MRTLLGIIVALLVIIVGSLAVFRFVDFNQMGAEKYYVQITGDGRVEEHKLDTGEIVKTYWYSLPAYDVNGLEKTFDFSAQKNLRQDAYLMLFAKDSKGVTSYEEVQLADIPEKAQKQLEN